jgi:DNA-binding NtrC family response regulator
VRELENVIERLVVMTRRTVDLADLPARVANTPRRAAGGLPDGDVDLPGFIEEIERELIQRALRRAGSNRTQAARSLGITREGLRYKLQKFGMDDA